MSFVVGFVSGMSTGEAVERRKERSHFREYMERRGFTVVDQHGRPVPLDTIVDEALLTEKPPGRTLLLAGAAVVAMVVLTGGTAWATAAIVS
jgi:hypothetical protein